MKALSLHQPYALLVAIGAKRVETRGWATTYRGPVLVHCSKQWDAMVAARCRWAAQQLAEAQFDWPGDFPDWRACCGHVLAFAELAACSKMTVPPPGLEGMFGAYGRGRYGFVFEGLLPILPPIPWPGAQKLWDVPTELHKQVRARVGREVAG